MPVAYLVHWRPPNERQKASWRNKDDATRDGAYCIVLATVEAELGLVAIGRAEGGTGADYYVGPPNSGVSPVDGELDLEAALRLKVSGIDSCDTEAFVAQRLSRKVDQARRGASNLPAIAGVVGFSVARIMLRHV